jgi:hypothetical protein
VQLLLLLALLFEKLKIIVCNSEAPAASTVQQLQRSVLSNQKRLEDLKAFHVARRPATSTAAMKRAAPR